MNGPNRLHGGAGAVGSASRSAGEPAARASNPTAPAAAGRLTDSRLSKLIAHSVGATGSDVTFGVVPALPASVEVDCRCAADRFLDRDAETLAHHSGLSARVLNHQRERHDDRKSALETVARMLWGARLAGWGYERRAGLAAPLLSALGADAAPLLPVVGTVGVEGSAPSAIRKAGAAIATALEAARDLRVTARELSESEPLIQEAITELHRLRRELQAAHSRTKD